MFTSSAGIILSIFSIIFFAVLLFFRGKSYADSFIDFAFGNGKINKYSLFGAIISSLVAGDVFIFFLEYGYFQGLISIVSMFLGSVSYVFISIFFSKDIMRKTMHPFRLNGVDFSVYEWAEREYDSYWIRFFLCLSEIIVRLGVIISNLKVIEFTFENVLGYDSKTSSFIMVFLGLLTIFFVISGGLKAIVSINIIFFILFIISIVVVAYFSYQDIDPEVNYLKILRNNPKIEVNDYFKTFSGSIFILGFWLQYFLPNVYGTHYQRIRMANANARGVKKAFVFGGFFDFSTKMIVFFIAFNIFCKNRSLEASELLPYVSENFCPGLVKMLLATALVAMSISFTASCLNSEAVLFVNDILPAFSKKNYKPNFRSALITTLVVGIICLLGALKVKDVFYLMLTLANFYIPIVSMPMMCLFGNINAHQGTVIISMICGAVSTIICIILTRGSLGCFFVGFLASFISYVITEFSLRRKDLRED